MAPALKASAWAVDLGRFPKGSRWLLQAALLWTGLTSASCSRRLVDHRALEMQVPTEIIELDPRFATRGLDVKASRLIHGGLVALDPDTLLPHPSLARSLRLAEGRTIAIELEPNTHFHSGHVLEASDVCATLDALRDPRLQSPHRAVVAAFSTCSVRDLQHAEVTLAYQRATWMTDLEIPILRADQANWPRGHAEELDGLGPYLIAGRTANALLLRKAAKTGEPPVGASVMIMRACFGYWQDKPISRSTPCHPLCCRSLPEAAGYRFRPDRAPTLHTYSCTMTAHRLQTRMSGVHYPLPSIGRRLSNICLIVTQSLPAGSFRRRTGPHRRT